jgi:hypothetical protein
MSGILQRLINLRYATAGSTFCTKWSFSSILEILNYRKPLITRLEDLSAWRIPLKTEKWAPPRNKPSIVIFFSGLKRDYTKQR